MLSTLSHCEESSKQYIVYFFFSREEDRDILVALKTKGASSKTFVALSSKLRKSQTQVFLVFIK